MDWQTFFDMGGNARFVWPCFGLVLFGLIVNLVQPWLAHKRLREQIRQQHRRQALRADNHQNPSSS